MKITAAEQRVLAELWVRAWTKWTLCAAIPMRRDVARRMLAKKLISKRAFADGYIVATELGRRAFEIAVRD